MRITATNSTRAWKRSHKTLCRASSGLETRKQTTAQKSALQRTMAVHPASAKTGYLPDRIKARDDVTVEPNTLPSRSVFIYTPTQC
jgi:hypothetical protein